jgi:hypothetical protein
MTLNLAVQAQSLYGHVKAGKFTTLSVPMALEVDRTMPLM